MNNLLFSLLIFLIGFAASIFGTLAGGGAFLTLPAMAALGVPLTVAISSHTFSNFGLNIGGFSRLKKNNLIHFKTGFVLAFFAFIGSIFGSYLVIHTPPTLIKGIFVFALIFFLALSLIDQKKGMTDKTLKKISRKNWIVGIILAILLGAYSGFLGAGVGTLYTYTLTFVFGHSFLESTGTKKIPGLFQAFGSWIVFAINGKMNYSIAIPLLLGMYLGAEIGIFFGIKFGNKFIKYLLLIITLVLLVKFLM